MNISRSRSSPTSSSSAASRSGTARSCCGLELVAELLVLALERLSRRKQVDGAMLGGGHEPGARIVRDARLRPLLQGGDQRVLSARSSARPTSRTMRVRPAISLADSIRQTASMRAVSAVSSCPRSEHPRPGAGRLGETRPARGWRTGFGRRVRSQAVGSAGLSGRRACFFARRAPAGDSSLASSCASVRLTSASGGIPSTGARFINVPRLGERNPRLEQAGIGAVDLGTQRECLLAESRRLARCAQDVAEGHRDGLFHDGTS